MHMQSIIHKYKLKLFAGGHGDAYSEYLIYYGQSRRFP